MRRSGRVPWSEVRIGMVVLFAFAVFMWAAFNGSGMSFFQKTNDLKAYFHDVGGLATGAPVWLGGIEVGHISSIKFVDRGEDGEIEVVFEIKDDAWPLVSNESDVGIGTMGLMGDKYLSLGVRKKGQSAATSGSTLRTRTGGDLAATMAEAPNMMKDFGTIMQRLNTILERIENGEGTLGRLTSDGQSADNIDSLVSTSRQTMAELQTSQKRLVSSIENASNAFDSLTTGVLHGGGTLSKLVWDTTLYSNMASMTTRMDNMVERWETGRGTVHQAMTDSTLYLEARDLVADTRALLDDIMINPKKYFKFSVF